MIFDHDIPGVNRLFDASAGLFKVIASTDSGVLPDWESFFAKPSGSLSPQQVVYFGSALSLRLRPSVNLHHRP